MSLWEYKVITSGKGGFATPALLEKFLNDLGRDEWEIVHFHSAAENFLAFTGLARRSTQRDWTLEDAAAAAAKVEAEKLRAEFEAKFKAGASAGGGGAPEERAPSFLEEKAAPDDGFRKPVDTSHEAFAEAERAVHERTTRLLSIDGKRTVDSFHRELGKVMWDYCGMARNADGLRTAIQRIPAIREEFWQNVNVPGSDAELNQALEKAGRIADFLELGELMCVDALQREESCGGHFREESQTPDGEALRDDERFAYVAAWEYGRDASSPILHKEPLAFEYVKLAQRSYK